MMKKVLLGLLMVAMCSVSLITEDNRTLAEGQQPQVSKDRKGVIRVVYGLDDKIFCAVSKDNGLSFSKPVLVGKIAGMHLGMSRGPQIACSDHYSVITAMDKAGNIHWFRLNNSSDKWVSMGTINDLAGNAPEGLMDIAADDRDNFYAVWLDIRMGKNNQVYFSALPAAQTRWNKNILAYRSPEGHVCECCQPHISVNGSEVAIMFRNWLNGSRDLYLLTSSNMGKSFASATKLGLDTWKLNGCPMDGGDILVNKGTAVSTTWQRKGEIFYCEPGKAEVSIGKGRNPSLTESGGNTLISFHNGDTVKMFNLKNKQVIKAGSGGFMKSVAVSSKQVLSIWEDRNEIKYRRISF